MTLTTTESSGARDHGQQGIHSFESDHVCGPVCEEMGLAGQDVQGLEDESEEEEDPPIHSKQGPKKTQGSDPAHYATDSTGNKK
ncbi:hypothetical protein GYMLUDRAFT_250506 [Collybiopsis luxurians FD-317 M1]|uniref:Alpha-type protein kinase domain-containing protein n=1 Tax=Collybiopsis luxurians FD-317 M1 TaxID=944289 RepID=A0A0D0BUH8_9AGAR|nr:hypothetical protein GYMLUDRAFT_250506 [Collybiopsis luxurians FD-317 M1]